MDISMKLSTVFNLILGTFCLKQQFEIPYIYIYLGPMSNFYNMKTKTLYQCMEICLQFKECQGVSYHLGICYLHGVEDYEMEPKCKCQVGYWKRTSFPDHISGACVNHNCSMDTRCMTLTGTSNHVCVPHGLPTFTMFTCPLLWLRHDRSWYRPFFVNTTWHSAYDQCKKENASLVEIYGKDTQNYMEAILGHFSNPMNAGKAVHKPGGQLYWTALTDEGTDGEWVWRGSGKMLASFTHWTANTTVWEKLVPGNDCVGMSTPDWFRWKPVKCDSLYFYVCEKLMVK